MSKLDDLLKSIPRNMVILDKLLHNYSISNSLKQNYLNAGKLISLGRGASYYYGDNPTWMGAISAIQKLHVGGKTALCIHGYLHFILNKLNELYLYGTSGTRLPEWLKKRDWGTEIKYLQSAFLPENLGIRLHKIEDFKLRVSSKERALLELISLIPENQSIEEAYYILENLSEIDMKLMLQLLESCKSLKVNRLFCYLANRAGHEWFRSIDTNKIRFGSGKRQVIVGGYLDPQYLITVPKDWRDDETSIF